MMTVRKSDVLAFMGKAATIAGIVLGTAAAISWHYGFHSVAIGFLVMAVTRIDIGHSASTAADLLNRDPEVWPPRSTTNSSSH